MTMPNLNTFRKTATNKNFPRYLKICLLIVASSFLVYSIYWAVRIPFSTHDIFVFISGPIFQNSPMNTPLSLQLILFQELAAAIGFLVNLIAAFLGFKSTIQFIKKDKKWKTTLGKALIFEAIFFLLFIPTSIHHIGGAILSLFGADFFVGLSYLLQVLLIVPPFIVLGLKIKNNQSQASIQKWVCITAPLFVFAFWLKYLFLWIDTLFPMGPEQLTIMIAVGALNSWLTLLIAGILTTVACFDFYKNKKMNKWFTGIALIMFGGYFIIYDFVAIWEPVYSWFFYVTDVWMVTITTLGTAILKLPKRSDFSYL